MSRNEISTNDSMEDYEDNSDDNLKIVIESPSQRRKTIPPVLTNSEKMIIESIEDEKGLEEKAAKTKLSKINVKNIIRHVVTNEDVLALVKKAENPSACDEYIPYEPKLTRAKAKELLSSVPIPSVPWSTPKQTSEVQVLFSEDLQDDDSGDEYIPGEDESEDDRDGSIISDPPSVPPATPPPLVPTNNQSDSQTNWTEDGVFKIPGSVRLDDTEEDTNIARRTRSKLCLSSTPLEVIEEAFIPPDITTDMYDMDCDNDDWMDFLKKFTRPLDEIVKATDDEELDPEYNILADEEIDKVDKEELRVDKAVKITRKELNNLIAELFECTDISAINDEIEADKNSKVSNYEEPITEIVESGETVNKSDSKAESLTVVIDEPNETDEEKCTDILIKKSQIPLLEQQMRQHVQLLTQNFLLSYEHPELQNLAMQSKEYLLNLKFLCESKQRSMFYSINLIQALNLIKYWEDLVASNTEEVKQMKQHIKKTMAESFHRRQAGNTDIPTFPKLILETISKSEVFLYPSLLPKIPFKPPSVFSKHIVSYTNSEDHLIALGLEQFVPIVKKQHKSTFSIHGDISMKVVCSYIQECMMPHKNVYKINNHIQKSKLPRCASNPIKYYFENYSAPPATHYVYPMNQLQLLPPCRRLPDELPHQWKKFNYPSQIQFDSASATEILKPQVYNKSLNVIRPLFPKGITSTPIISTPSYTTILRRRKKRLKGRRLHCNVIKVKNDLDPISKFIKCLSQPSQIFKLLSIYPPAKNIHSDNSIEEKENSVETSETYKSFVCNTMMPSMPSIGTPVRNHPQSEVSSSTSSDNKNQDITSTNAECGTTKGESRKSTHLEFSTISSTSFQQPDTSTEVEFCNPTDSCQTITSTCNVNSVASTSFQNLSSTPSHEQARSNTGTKSKLRQDTIKGNLEKDNPDDINALFIASSTLKPAAKKEPSGAEKKRAKLKREFLANLAISTPEDPEVERQKNEMFALAYYDKMRESLDLEDYHKIMQILNDHEEGDAVDLYKKVEKVLSPKYQELADEFLLFLREKEAAAVGQLVPWIRMNNRSKFLRKLEIYFKDQPSQLRKIYKCLTELSQTVNVSMEKIKTTLVPMFKGNAVLSDLFLQSFLDEGPPPSLLEGPYETIDVTKEMSRPDDEEIVETITVPDVEDKYGGPSCICNCHQIEDPEFKSRYRHCIRCGTRFMNGKVYVQTGRGLRPATVTFLTNPNVDHNVRLIGKTPTITNQRKKRSDNSPSKQVTLSPTKENLDEETEDEIDGKKKKKKKSPKRKRPSNKSLKDSKESRKSTATKKNVTGKCDSAKFSGVSPTRKDYKSGSRKRTYSARKSKGKVVKKSDTHEVEEKELTELDLGSPPPVEEKRSEEESMEWDAVTGESSVDMKPSSSGHQTAESESEVYEESSQDNCESDSNSSISSSNNQSQSDSNTGEECSWKREEDKIILETFQKENDKENAFKIISNQLKNRTVDQISSRFQTLMDLLLETLGTS